MKLVHVRSIEKYHPGYKDRVLQWAKIHFRMVQGDPDCEMIAEEIDFARLIKFIILELEAKHPIPISEEYLTRKGFNLKKRPIELTLNMLHNFLEVIQEESEMRAIEKSREELDKIKRREDIMSFAAFEKAVVDLWNSFCEKHPVLTKIKEVSEKRRLKLKKRYEKESFRNFQAILTEFEKQPFLFGENERKWTAGLDWLVENDTNYVKVLEGFYMSKKSSGVDKYILPRKN